MTSMSCTRARRYALPYLDSELGAETSLELAHHLEECEPCRRRFEGERQFERNVRAELAAVEPRESQAFERALAAATRSGHEPWSRTSTLATVVASALLSAAAVPWLLSVLGGEPDRGAARPRAAETRLATRVLEDVQTMKPTTVLGASVVASVAVAASTSALLDSGGGEAKQPELSAEAQQLELIRERQAALEASLAELRTLLEEGEMARPTETRQAVMDARALDEAIARALERRGLAPEEPLAVAATPSEDDLRAAAALVQRLMDPFLPPGEREELWRELFEAGQLAAAVTELERHVEAAPFDPLVRTTLGEAYLHMIATTDGGREAGRWGSKGSETLQKALELDPLHWEARFTLARHYDNAQMRGDAIHQLKTLVAQQESRVNEDKHSDAYLWLGNLHMNAGDLELAEAAWRAGLSVFPNSETLQERLQALE